jgi:ACR3 family arsenite transporter
MIKMKSKKLSFFEQYLTIWVLLCIVAGILIGKIAPNFAIALNDFSVYQVSIPIAICLFFMMYPIMVKIDFMQVINATNPASPSFSNNS